MRSFRAFVLVLLALAACTGNPRPGSSVASACMGSGSGSESSSGIDGELHFVMTVGAVTSGDYSWAASAPHAGVVEIESQGSSGIVRHHVGNNGAFSIGLAPGRYRVSGYIPGAREQDYPEQPIIVDSHTVTVTQNRCTPVRLLVYQWLP